MEPCSTVASPSAATSFLFDIVVFAGGTTDGFSPLCTNDPKPMLSICNRPMIWYCLYPLYKTGCRTFFICVNEDYVPLQSYLHKQFSDVNFIFILVPFEQNKRRSTTCDVVKAYLEHKETMQASSLRDALLLSCDTFLPGVDLEPFIRDFYCSAASVSVLLFRPLPKCPSSTSAWGGHGSPVKSYVHRRTCVAYEENNESIQRSPPSQNNNNNNNNHNDNNTNTTTTTTTNNNNNNLMEDDDENINHHRDRHVHSKRLHFICPFEEAQELRLTLGFASRRPNLTFSSDVTDVHAYLVRNWALHAMAESSHDDISVQKDIIPMYARSQHCTINEKKKVFMKPEQKINYKIPKHWLLEGDCLMRFLNASSSQAIFPEDTDNLLVSCTIYDEDADTGMKAYRVRTREDYVAITQEILAAKSQLLDNNNNSGSYAKKKNTFTFSSASSFLLTDKKHGTSHLLFPLSHQSSLALSTLLPDDSFTVQWKDEENKMAINHSFVQSEPNCGVNISRSVVGKNVVLGTQVRITNSIILDNVEIGASTVITNSVIGASAMITSGVSVKNCTVGPHCVVESNETDRVIRT